MAVSGSDILLYHFAVSGNDILLYHMAAAGSDILLYQMAVSGNDILLYHMAASGSDILLYHTAVSGNDILLAVSGSVVTSFHRTVKHPMPELSNPHRLIVDGELIWKFLHLSLNERTEVARRLGTAVEQIVDDLLEIDRVTAHF